ncbi:hypothetical protein [Brumimicrobium glaciale]|nr:hypothetical protein [Brumimicrobium glaciale]
MSERKWNGDFRLPLGWNHTVVGLFSTWVIQQYVSSLHIYN